MADLTDDAVRWLVRARQHLAEHRERLRMLEVGQISTREISLLNPNQRDSTPQSMLRLKETISLLECAIDQISRKVTMREPLA